MSAKLFLPETDAKPMAVLFLHGWKGVPNEEAAVVLAVRGYAAMTVSLRGHNDSDGDIRTISRQDSLADAIAAYDYLVSQLPKGYGIVVAGNSYGGYLAALLSAQRPITALSLRVPAPYVDEGFSEPQFGKGHDDPAVMQWRLAPHDYKGNKGFQAVHDFSGPIQIIEAELDDFVPHQGVENFRQAIKTNSQLDDHFMIGWPHSLGYEVPRNGEFQKILLDWLNTLTEVY